ncbi:MAG: IPTL-CTERM sorting domain-containing protein [Candidatus Eiseniibacteriota bacterium]
MFLPALSHRRRRNRAASTVRLSLFAVLLLGRPAGAAVTINEFDRGAATDSVEIFNSGPGMVTLTGWTLRNNLADTIVLSGVIAPGGFVTQAKASFVPEGGQIELLDGTLFQMDQVSYGDQGAAPLPPLNAGYSCARVTNGLDTGNLATDFTLDATSTFQASNNPGTPMLGGLTVKNNEAGKSGPSPSDRAMVCSSSYLVELYNSSGTVSLSGWWLTDGRDVMSLTSFGSIGPGAVKVISGFPVNFCFEETQVLYLFDGLGRRVDQWGFSGTSLASASVSWQRFPDGAGPNDGFTFATSGGGTNVFVVAESFGFLNGASPPLPGTPTMSEWALLVLAVAVLATGVIASRRRRFAVR